MNSSTYLGDDKEERVVAITTDALGNTYLTGIRYLDRVPHIGSPASDLFVIKQDAAGDVEFIASAGGPEDFASAITTDPSGGVYVAGSSISGGGRGGLLIKLSAAGIVLYSKHLSGTSGLNAVATDAQGNAYVTGSAVASDYPHTSGLPAPPGPAAFFAKVSASGDQILYAGAIGGTKAAYCTAPSSCGPASIGTGVAVDAQGNAYVFGNTNTTDLPVTSGAFQPQGVGAFVAKIRADGSGLAYLTYLDYNLVAYGYGWPTAGTAIAVDAAGNAYLAGVTTNSSFPVTPNAYRTTFGSAAGPPPQNDIFVVKLRPDGAALVWATYLGRDGTAFSATLAVDPSGKVWASGYTSPAVGRGRQVLFLVQLNPTGSALLYSMQNLPGYQIASDQNGAVHIAGGAAVVTTITPDAPSTPLIAGIAAGGSASMPEGLIVPAEVISIYGTQLGPSLPVVAAPDGSGFYPSSLGGVQVLIGGIPAPLLYVSDTQINAVTPAELTALSTTTVQIVRDGVAAPTFRAVVMPGLPSVFRTADGNAVINQDGTMNSGANPAKIGSVVSIWATGIRPRTGVNGRITTSANNNCDCSVQLGNILFKVVDAQVLYCGDAPGFVFGVTQINVRIPEGVTSSSINLTAGGISTAGGSGSAPISLTP